MKLHNAMWPGLVGKEPGTDHPPISLERMIELTAKASVDGQKFDGVDLFLFHPHTDPDASESDLRKMADKIAAKNLAVGSMVAPVWPGTVGDSAMGTVEQRRKFIDAVRKACRIARILNEHGVRKYGVIRIDSATPTKAATKNPKQAIKQIAATFREAGMVAAGHGERLAAEGEICWAGMHSLKSMLALLETVDMPGTVGFQADLAHTEPARMTRPAAIAKPTIPMASSTSPNARRLGSKARPSAASNTFAGTDACSPTPCSRSKRLGTPCCAR